MVSKWEDASGAGNHATQSANNVRPAVVAEAFGARPALAFDEDDFLRLPAGFSDFSEGLSVFGLVSFDETTSCTALFHLGNGPEVDDIEIGHVNGAYQYEVADQYPQGSAFEFRRASAAGGRASPNDQRRNAPESKSGRQRRPRWCLPASVERTDNVVGRSLYSTLHLDAREARRAHRLRARGERRGAGRHRALSSAALRLLQQLSSVERRLSTDHPRVTPRAPRRRDHVTANAPRPLGRSSIRRANPCERPRSSSLSSSLLGACTDPPLEVADGVKLERFQGRWYEIAKLKRPTQTNCFGTIANYALDGK